MDTVPGGSVLETRMNNTEARGSSNTDSWGQKKGEHYSTSIIFKFSYYMFQEHFCWTRNSVYEDLIDVNSRQVFIKSHQIGQMIQLTYCLVSKLGFNVLVKLPKTTHICTECKKYSPIILLSSSWFCPNTVCLRIQSKFPSFEQNHSKSSIKTKWINGYDMNWNEDLDGHLWKQVVKQDPDMLREVNHHYG